MSPSPAEPRSFAMPIASAEDADQATRVVRDKARSFGFCALEANLIASATSELVMNIVLHAGHGTARLRHSDDERGLEITFSDDGPGIVDIERAMEEGYSSRPDGLGIGLTAAAQAVDFFDIESAPGAGTVATLRHFLPHVPGAFDVGIVSLADPAGPINGEVACTRTMSGQRQLLAVIDGTGPGEPGREAALRARRAIESRPAAGPRELAELVHRGVPGHASEHGVALALLLAGRDELRLVSVGGVACRVFDATDGSEPVRFAACPGRLGTRRPARFAEQRVDLPRTGGALIVVLASDGVSPEFATRGRVTDEHPLEIAHALLRDFRRAHGDATVAVLRIAR